METKKCSKCGEVKLLDEFGKDNSKKDGFNIYCKKCKNLMDKKYYAENLEKIKEKQKKHRAENPEKHRSYHNKWKAKNPEKIKAIFKKFRANNAAKIKAYSKKYYEENTEKAKEKQKRYYAENLEKINAGQKASRDNLKDHYISELIGIPRAELPPELIELKRNIIKLKRAKNERSKSNRNSKRQTVKCN